MEGPTLLILKEAATPFIGQKIKDASGTQKLDFDRIIGQSITDLQHWGKHFLIVLEDCTIRIHYLMFGHYYINSRHPQREAKLSLHFKNSEWNNYLCAAKIVEGTDVHNWYDWTVDVMSDEWDPAQARKKLKAAPQTMICDALMDQGLFAGVGNVIKVEALHRCSIHPEELIQNLTPVQITAITDEARAYSFDFYRWELEGVRRKKYCVYRRARCPHCGSRVEKKFTGVTPRSSFWCPQCQPLKAPHLHKS